MRQSERSKFYGSISCISSTSTPEKAADVAALPYDVVNREEAKAIGDKNPDSFLHVDRAEMDLPDETDLYDSKVYESARQNL